MFWSAPLSAPASRMRATRRSNAATDRLVSAVLGFALDFGLRAIILEGSPVNKTFDAIVVGAGQDGPAMVERLATAGMTVAIVERHLFG